MRVVNKLTAPGGVRRVDLRPSAVKVITADGQERFYRLESVSGGGNEDKAIADNMRDYWKHLASGAER